MAGRTARTGDNQADRRQQETMNFWKQNNHVMSYFKEENFRGDHRLPSSFMSGFLEVRTTLYCPLCEGDNLLTCC